MNDEDRAFLEVLEKLEANECDDDSILAPFSQKDEKTEVILSQKMVSPTDDAHRTNGPTTDQNYFDEDDDDWLNEFSKNLDDLLPQDAYVIFGDLAGKRHRFTQKNLFF